MLHLLVAVAISLSNQMLLEIYKFEEKVEINNII